MNVTKHAPQKGYGLKRAGFPYSPEQQIRWIDNHAYRLSGGWVHTKEVRFGDEAGCPMNAVRNFAPHICIPLDSGIPNDGDKLCGLPPPTGPLPANITGGWSSIIIEGGYLCAAGSDRKADIVLDQVPAQLGEGRFFPTVFC